MFENGEEIIIIRTKNGPHSGTRYVPLSTLGEWPLPDILPGNFLGGRYKKISQSNLDAVVHPNVMRGAEYHWEVDPEQN